MSKLLRIWITVLVALGLLAGAGVSWADDDVPAEPTDEQAAVETMVNFAYDQENHVFIVNAWTSDAGYDCALDGNALKVGYGTVEDGSLEITPDSESGWNGECILHGGVVAGPNGQINHGQFMKLFHQIVGRQANGCLNRMIAQSDLGKGDQQLRTSDVEEGFEANETGTAVFEGFTADCSHGKKDRGEDHPSNQAKDKAKQGEDGSPGKSGSARGRNK